MSVRLPVSYHKAENRFVLNFNFASWGKNSFCFILRFMMVQRTGKRTRYNMQPSIPLGSKTFVSGPVKICGLGAGQPAGCFSDCVCLSVSVCLSICLCTNPSFHPAIYIYIYIYICISTYVSVFYLSVCVCVCVCLCV